jgi:uncharacterized protein YndB with AHSA1/START domain
MVLLLWVLLVAAGVLVVLVGAVWVVGKSLPEGHEVSRSARIAAPIDDVWKVIIDFESQPSWRPSVKGVERVETSGGEVWREAAGGDPISFRTLKADPPVQLVRAIVGDNLPFSGRWEFLLSPSDAATNVTIVERGEITSPIFRFAARIVLGYATSVETYLNDLTVRFGGTPPFGRSTRRLA